MVNRSAEESFMRGLEALNRGRAIEALAFFEAAVELHRRYVGPGPQARYLSYYGLTLGLEGSRLREGIRLCRDATELEFFNPDLFCNLGRVLLMARQRREAFEALQEGIALESAHGGIRRELERMGIRRPPVLPFLPRGNPINVLLGRLSRVAAPLPARAPRLVRP